MKEISLTLHARKRFKSRMKLTSTKKQDEFVEQALLHGIRFENLPDGEIKQWLYSEEHCKKIVYQSWVLVFGKNNKRLLTLYEMPKELQEGNLQNDKQ